MPLPEPDRPLEAALAAALGWADALGTASRCQLILDSGSLLGLVRENGVLAGDNEIDLSVVEAGAADRILRALKGPRQVWHYDGRPYRVEIPAGPGGPPLPAEIKFFRRDGEAFVCPAIGFSSPGGSKTRKSGWRAMLRPVWRALLARGDAARFPFNRLTRVDRWVVPAQYFVELAPAAGHTHCVTPAAVESFLDYRYGDWRHPVRDWVTWRDDGAYQSDSEAIRAARLASPHRRVG